MFRTFLIYVASSPRPPHELLNPNLIDLDQPYAREFEGMTKEAVDLGEIVITPQSESEVESGPELAPSDRDVEPTQKEAPLSAAAFDPHMTLRQVEEATIRRAIDSHGGNLSAAARTLGISRSVMYRKLERYGIRAARS